MYPIPNGFRDTAISLYSSKTVDKKEILRTVSNFFSIGATAPIWALAYLHETLCFTSVF
jgi:hypothetical protein